MLLASLINQICSLDSLLAEDEVVECKVTSLRELMKEEGCLSFLRVSPLLQQKILNLCPDALSKGIREEHRVRRDGRGSGEGSGVKSGGQHHHLLPEIWLHNQG